MLNIKCEDQGKTRIYYLSGEIDSMTAKDLSEQVDTTSCDEIVFDMSRLLYTTSAGIRVLVQTNLLMKEKGGRMSVRNVNSMVSEIFEMTGLKSIITG